MLRGFCTLATVLFAAGCGLPLSGLGNPDGGTDTCPGTLESCDGTDEDCDGRVDEELTRACGTAGTCGGGSQQCEAGEWGACMPRTDWPDEECDGATDEDCDGAVDEGCDCSPVGTTRGCGSDVGECVTGEQECGADGMWGLCTGTVTPSPEQCDGLDNDCDGAVDGQTEQCREARGICTDGSRSCQMGTWTDCDGTGPGPVELCDVAMLDENCNGMANEACACVDGETQACGSGSCVGLQTCDATGAFGTCVPASVSVETCNGLDDDCDGVIDNATANCAGETTCDVVRRGTTVYLLCYQGSTDLRSDYDEAIAFCAARGYHLVTIDDGAENNFLASRMDSRDRGDWWIGFNDRDDDGVYTWVFGSSTFTDWRSAPDPDKCATLDSDAGDWEDKNCGDNRAFVCEANP